LDYQIKGKKVETAGHMPTVSEEKSTQGLVRKRKGKIAIQEDVAFCVKELAWLSTEKNKDTIF
jgi:uncharacterized membrane protein